jgi:hypothetical protein
MLGYVRAELMSKRKNARFAFTIMGGRSKKGDVHKIISFSLLAWSMQEIAECGLAKGIEHRA